MTAPTPDLIEVAKGDMYREADLWDKQAGRLADFAFQADQSTIDHYDVFLFNAFLTNYNEVCRVFARLCTQGELVTREIAGTLRTVASIYAEADNGLRTQYDRY